MFRTFTCPKHVEAIYENKIIVKLFASSWYISLLIYMMHGHTYIKKFVIATGS